MQNTLNKLLLPLRDRGVEYLVEDLQIKSQAQEISAKVFENPASIKDSSLIATTGSIEVFIAIGYDGTLFEEFVKFFLQGEDVEGEELIELKESISCEIINVIVGNAIKDPYDDSALNITPPLFIDEISSVFKDSNCDVVTTSITTDYGNMYIAIAHPFKKYLQ